MSTVGEKRSREPEPGGRDELSGNTVLLTESEIQAVDEFRRSRNTAVLAIMFTDMAGSTEIAETYGDLLSDRLRGDHDKILIDQIQKNGRGRCIKKEGDAIMAVFAEPSAGVECALDIQRQIRHYNLDHSDRPEIKICIGIDMGQVTVENQISEDVFGVHVNRAARIRAECTPGTTYLSFVVYTTALPRLRHNKGLIWRNHGEFQLKGVTEPERIYEVCERQSVPKEGLLNLASTLLQQVFRTRNAKLILAGLLCVIIASYSLNIKSLFCQNFPGLKICSSTATATTSPQSGFTGSPVKPTVTLPETSEVQPSSPVGSEQATMERIELNPPAFVLQGDEFFLDVRYGTIPGLLVRDGIDLSNYDLEFTFQGGDGRLVQLWYKDRRWANVYSRPHAITSNRPIRYNPMADGRSVSQFNDFTNIYAIGTKIFGGLQGVRIVSAKLINRQVSSSPPPLKTQLRIASVIPKPEDCHSNSQCIITVNVTWVRADAREKKLRLYVLARPIPDDPNQSYWVQAIPKVDDEGQWSSSPVYVGQPGDRPGLPFRICAVATDQSLFRGQQLGAPPSGPRSCVDVTRGRP